MYRVYAAILFRKYLGPTSVDQTLRLLRCYLDEEDATVLENLKDSLAGICRKNLSLDECLNLVHTLIEEEKEQVRAYALVA